MLTVTNSFRCSYGWGHASFMAAISMGKTDQYVFAVFFYSVLFMVIYSVLLTNYWHDHKLLA